MALQAKRRFPWFTPTTSCWAWWFFCFCCRVLALYHTGLNITGAALLARGITQVLAMPLSRGADAAISGIAGIGHLLLGISLVLLLLAIRKKA